MFAYAFARTKSIYAPLGLHFGWIVMSIVVLSEGPLGNSLFLIEGETIELGGWEQLLFFLWQTMIIPIVVVSFFSIFQFLFDNLPRILTSIFLKP